MGKHLLTATLERRGDHLNNAPINAIRSQDALALGYGWTNRNHSLQLNLRSDQDSAFGGYTTGSAAYGFALSPQWRATASAGTAFRAPTLYQLFSEYGVSTLQPETSRNLELGLRYTQGTGRFSFVAYRNLVSNLISFGTAGPCASSLGRYTNTAQAEYTGLTFSGRQQLGTVNLHGSLDLQDPRDLTNGNLLARRARQYGTFGADTFVGAWTVGTEAQFSGYRYDNAANTWRLGGYSLINLYDAAVKSLQALAPSWPVGVHGVAMLHNWVQADTQAWLAKSRSLLQAWKQRQLTALKELGWDCLPSLANFFCARAPTDIDLPAMRAAGIKLRDAASLGLPGFFRLAVLPPSAQDALFAQLQHDLQVGKVLSEDGV